MWGTQGFRGVLGDIWGVHRGVRSLRVLGGVCLKKVWGGLKGSGGLCRGLEASQGVFGGERT